MGEAPSVDTMVFILGDQLSHSISSLEVFDPDTDVILMCEVMDEATYVRHHKKKVAFILVRCATSLRNCKTRVSAFDTSRSTTRATRGHLTASSDAR